MTINKDFSYTIKDASEVTGVHPRTLTRYASTIKAEKIDGRYIFTGLQLQEYLDKRKPKDLHYQKEKDTVDNSQIMSNAVNQLKAENEKLKSQIEELKKSIKEPLSHQEKLRKAIELITVEAVKKGVTHKIFSEEEYNDIIGTIAEVDFQREQVNYLKARIEKQDNVLLQLSEHLKTTNKTIEQRNFIEAKDKNYD